MINEAPASAVSACAPPLTTSRIIYLDMDGVCCDFHAAVLRLHGRDPDVEFIRWARDFPAEFHPHRVLGMDRDAFWEPVHRAGADFWAELRPYPWLDALMDGLGRRGRIVFLSSGTWEGGCLAGKLRWLQTRFGRAFSNYVFTPHKNLLGSPNTVLIDDYPQNVAAFSQAGGCGILFPRIWNSPAPASDPLPEIFARLDASHL